MTTAADFHVQRTSPTRLGRVGFVLAALILATGVWLAGSIAVDASPAAAEGESATYPSTPQTVAPLGFVCADGFVASGPNCFRVGDTDELVPAIIECNTGGDVATCDADDLTYRCLAGTIVDLNIFGACVDLSVTNTAGSDILRSAPIEAICPAGSFPSGLTCIRSTSSDNTETPPTIRPVEFTCPEGFSASGNHCFRATGLEYLVENPIGVICPFGSAPSGLSCVPAPISKTTSSPTSTATPTSPTSTVTPLTVPPVEFVCPAGYDATNNGCLRIVQANTLVEAVAECSTGSDIATCDPADLTYRCPAGTTPQSNQVDQCTRPGSSTESIAPLGVRCPAGSTPSGLTCVLTQATNGAATTAPTATQAPAATPVATVAPTPTAVAVTVITTPAVTSGVVMSAADAGFTNGIPHQPAAVRQPPLAVTGLTVAPLLLVALGFVAIGATAMATRNRRQDFAGS